MGRVIFDVGQAQGQIGLFLRTPAQGFRRHRLPLVGQDAQTRIFQRGADAPPAAARDAGEDVRGLADDLRLALALKNALGVEQDFAGQGPAAPGQGHALHAFQQQRFLLAQFRQIVGPGQGRDLGAQTGHGGGQILFLVLNAVELFLNGGAAFFLALLLLFPEGGQKFRQGQGIGGQTQGVLQVLAAAAQIPLLVAQGGQT